jgi:hypothetical protein
VRHLVAGELAAAPSGKLGQEPTRVCDQRLALAEEILAKTSSS